MESTITNIESANKIEESKRSASYPAFDIIQSFDFANKINSQFSATAEISRGQIAAAFELSNGSIVRDISTCVQFGFLRKNTAQGTYQLTGLFLDVFRPESDKEKKIKLITAFGLPPLYNELIKKFDNNVIPNELANTLIKNHNIREKVAQNVAEIFISSGKQVGVINDSRFLKYKITQSTLELQKTSHVESEKDELENKNQDNNNKEDAVLKLPTFNPKDNREHINIPIHLTNNKVAIFSYPEDITENDIKIVQHQLAGVLLRISLEKDEKKEGTDVPS